MTVFMHTMDTSSVAIQYNLLNALPSKKFAHPSASPVHHWTRVSVKLGLAFCSPLQLII